MDLLGSILGSMEKPPTVGQAERKKARGHSPKCIFVKIDDNGKSRLEVMIRN